MNTILQKRIEEAAKMYNARSYSPFDDPYELSKEFERDCYCFKEGANYALSNQWISVEEALPEENVFVFVRGENTLGTFFNSDYIGCNGDWYLLSNYGTVPDRKITHWMPIPSLKGGEK